MQATQKVGGIAALAAAATNLLGLVVFLTLLAPKGIGDTDASPSKIVALYADNEAAMRAWYLIIYLGFGACVILLVLALQQRLKARSSAMASVVTTFGLIYAVLVLVIGTLSITNLSTLVDLHDANPVGAATVYSALTSVETGLGAGGGETLTLALWLLLLSLAAQQVQALPKFLNYLGEFLGVAGVLSVVLNSLVLMSVDGLGLIAWFVWLGITLLRSDTASTMETEGLRGAPVAAR